MAAKRTTTKAKSAQDRGPHPAEWLIGGVAAVVVVVLLGYLTYLGVANGGRAPEFVLSVEKVDRVGEGFHVNVAVTNAGQATAAAVVVRATLGEEEVVIETGEIEFDYLPAGSTRRGAFVVSNDPAPPRELVLSVIGYTDP